MILRKCCAPAAYGAATQCGREFVPYVDHQLYCSPRCANRAHKRQRKENRTAKALGLPTQPPGFPESLRQALATQHGNEARSPPSPGTLTSVLPSAQTVVVPPSAIIDEVRRLEAIDAATAIDSDDILAQLGYLPREERRGIEPTRLKADVDRAAEPRPKVSTEDEAPDFRAEIDEADAPLLYPEDEPSLDKL